MLYPHGCLSHISFSTYTPQGYDISFLITNFQVEKMWKVKLIDFIIQVTNC